MTTTSLLRLCAITCLGFYGADMHKLLLTIIAFLTGEPLAFAEYGRIADITFALLTAGLTFVVFASTNFNTRPLMNVPLAWMFLLGILMTLSLIQSSDELSVEHYYRFVGGNFLLFVCALLCCNSLGNVRQILNIWVTNGVILAALSIYLFQTEVTWSTGRSSLFPGTGIRSGYFCALAIIYLISGILFRTKRHGLYFRFGLIGILLAGVLFSGSKASLLLLLASVAALFTLKLLITKQLSVPLSLSVFVVLLFFGSVIIKSIVGLEMSGGSVGSVGDILRLDSYLQGGDDRIILFKDYIALGMKSPLTGHGISAAYSLYHRTHSMTSSLFVQLGLIGLSAYLFFLLAVVFRGSQVMVALARQRYRSRDISMLVAVFVGVIFLVLKAEITGDVAANRELWMFAGVFITVCRVIGQDTVGRQPDGLRQ